MHAMHVRGEKKKAWQSQYLFGFLKTGLKTDLTELGVAGGGSSRGGREYRVKRGASVVAMAEKNTQPRS